MPFSAMFRSPGRNSRRNGGSTGYMGELKMNRFCCLVAACFSFLPALPAIAEQIAGTTADGTWDCPDGNGGIVIAGTSYAFIAPDGLVSGYGDIHFVSKEEVFLPTFIFMSGPMKDEMASPGGAMTGPAANPHDYTGELFLKIILPKEVFLECRRRQAPGA